MRAAVRARRGGLPGMLTRPAGHEAEAQKFFEAEATMHDAEARHVRDQLSVYVHED